MVNNSFNMSKANNHISPQIIENKETTTSYDVPNTCHVIVQAQNVAALDRILVSKSSTS